MKRVATFLSSSIGGCEFYRGIGVLSELRRYDIDIKIINGSISWAELCDCDIAFLQRIHSSKHVDLCKFIVKQMPLWVDYDDLLTEVPISNPAYATYSNPELGINIARILQLANVISVSTEFLGKKLIELNTLYNGRDIKDKIVVIHNTYNDYRLPTKYAPSEHENKLVLWRGTSSHISDLTSMSEDLNYLIRTCDDVIFTFMGFIPWMLDLTLPNIKLVEEVDIFVYMETLEYINPDVVIVPLIDIDFNKTKSNIAWLETARFGSNVVAPDWDEWKKPGIHRYKEGDFISKVKEALVQPRSNTSWNYISKDLLLSKVNKQRVDIINEY